jgi:hypothetical protein
MDRYDGGGEGGVRWVMRGGHDGALCWGGKDESNDEGR